MKDGIYYISRNSDKYPLKFRDLSRMPDGIYVKGELPDDNIPSVAVVGARMCSRYGHNTAFAFGRKLAESGIQVISGMALGIDGAAQEGALAGGGKTFAVLGCGVDVCYPRSNMMLYKQIPEQGGILSELEPGTKPLSYNFPIRNRLISALSDIVVVVEARKKSGSLITVDYALEQGKSVYAVPGRVGDVLSDGCNYLIAQGAGIAWSVETILEEIYMQSSLTNAARASREAAMKRLHLEMSKTEPEIIYDEKFGKSSLPSDTDPRSVKERILLCLAGEEKNLEELSVELNLSVRELNAALGELTLLGLIEEVGRNRYVRSSEAIR